MMLTRRITRWIISFLLILVTLYHTIRPYIPDFWSYISPHIYHHDSIVEELILEKGFQTQIYQSQTIDGCTITTHRILPNVKNENNDRVVFLQHGLMESPSVYVAYESSLCIQLASMGYDVWMGNNRSTVYGQDNQSDNSEFWEFTIDDIIQNDLICQIDTILRTTGTKKLAFFGQSQGCGQLIGTLHNHPEMKKKLSFVGLITPGVCIRTPDNPILHFLSMIPPKYWGKRQWVPTQIITIAQRLVPECLMGKCAYIAMTLLSFIQTECSVDDRIFRNVPHGSTSALHLAHWFQMIRSPGILRKFDYESYQKNDYSENVETEEYHPSILDDLPVSVLLGGKDPVIDLELSLSVFKKHRVHVQEDFGHIDFTWSLEGSKFATPLLINHLQEMALW
jgi:pimeloyl-ACP methyl ester carboxylesterase